jgi:hypothetical protein
MVGEYYFPDYDELPNEPVEPSPAVDADEFLEPDLNELT